MMASQRSTPSETEGLDLMEGFSEPSHEQWQQQVEKVLRRSGLLARDAPSPAAPEDLLATTTYDGVRVRPLYTSADEHPGAGVPGFSPFVRGTRPQGSVTTGWDVRQRHADPDASVTNREVHADLSGGASSVWLRVGPGAIAVDDVADALHGVRLDLAAVVLEAGDQAAEAAEALLALAADQGVSPGAMRGNLGADPIGELARGGSEPNWAAAIDLARRCADNDTGLHAVAVDGLPYHEAGGSDAEELACSIAAGVAYLRQLTAEAPEGAGLDVDTAARLVEFRYAATAEQFTTIAKLRAARRMWERVTRVCGVSEHARAQAQHAVTSPAMFARRDPWVNMLRTTIAALAAGIGGAQAVTTLPFDAALGKPDGFARRIARNTQSLLVDESHLAQVIDPAGGSWYVESLTDQLAGAAWARFQEIEAEGGMPAALESGLVGDRLASTWKERRWAIAHRTDPITGVSEYPDLAEEPVVREAAQPEEPGDGLPRRRYAEEYERLRDAADEMARGGDRPHVFLATLGSLAEYNARASFARNLFAAGGVECSEAGPTDSAEQVVSAYERASSPVVCLCSSGTVYADRAAETATALKQAGARQVLLAGRPTDPSPDGVDGFVHQGCDALQALTDVHRTWRNGATQ